LLHALATDQVLSLGQLERHFNLSETDVRRLGVRVFGVAVSKTKGSTRQANYQFVIRKGKQAPQDGATVRHLTGTAEMRHLLGAPHDVWVSDAGRRWAKHKPDALWTTPQGVVAIEYDAGSYDPTRIADKLMSFKAGYVGQIWGTPSRARAEHLRDLARNLVPDLYVLYAPWF